MASHNVLLFFNGCYWFCNLQMGVSLQLLSIIAEAARIVLIQILLQRQGLKLNPLSTMYYVAPACIVCLLPAALVLELPALRQKLARDDPLPSVSMFALNGIGAVTLNLTVYLVLGQMPALMMNAAGVVKDWLLIYLSRLLFASPITKVQLCGYTLAFLGTSIQFQHRSKSILAKSATRYVILHLREWLQTLVLCEYTQVLQCTTTHGSLRSAKSSSSSSKPQCNCIRIEQILMVRASKTRQAQPSRAQLIRHYILQSSSAYHGSHHGGTNASKAEEAPGGALAHCWCWFAAEWS